jgi:hypothetical protein
MYLAAMDRQRKWDLDPRLAEDFANREERANNHNQELQARQGDIAAHGIERMGDVLSNGLKDGYQAYRQGKADRTQQNFDKIRYDRLRAEDEYWNGPWDGAGIGGTSSYGASGGNGGGASGDGGLGPNSLGNDGSPALGTIQQAGGGMAEDDAPRTVRLEPSRSFSPGAVAVLDGKAKPGFNPAVTGMQNPTTDYLQGKTSTPQYLGLNRPQPMPMPGAAGQPSGPATNPSQAAAPSGAGAGIGTAPSDFASRQIVSRGTTYDGDPSKTRLQHKWDLGLIKSEEEIDQMRKGKNGRNAPWINTGKFDAEGHPIRFNQLTGEYAVDSGVTGQAPKDPTAMTQYQQGQLEIGKEKNRIDAVKAAKDGKSGGLTPYQQWQIDHANQNDQNRRDDKKNDKIDKGATKYSADLQKTNIPAVTAQLEHIHTILDAKEDVPGYGMTAAAPDFAISKEGQDLRQSVGNLFNIELRNRSGQAVTDSELQRLKGEFGQGGWKTDRQLREGIRLYESRLKEVIKNINAGERPEVIDEYTNRGGNDYRGYEPAPEYKWDKSGKRYKRAKNPATGEMGWMAAP